MDSIYLEHGFIKSFFVVVKDTITSIDFIEHLPFHLYERGDDYNLYSYDNGIKFMCNKSCTNILAAAQSNLSFLFTFFPYCHMFKDVRLSQEPELIKSLREQIDKDILAGALTNE